MAYFKKHCKPAFKWAFLPVSLQPPVKIFRNLPSAVLSRSPYGCLISIRMHLLNGCVGGHQIEGVDFEQIEAPAPLQKGKKKMFHVQVPSTKAIFCNTEYLRETSAVRFCPLEITRASRGFKYAVIGLFSVRKSDTETNITNSPSDMVSQISATTLPRSLWAFVMSLSRNWSSIVLAERVSSRGNFSIWKCCWEYYVKCV